MIGQTRLFTALRGMIKRAKADAASACVDAGQRLVFRFAQGGIHQDVLQERLTASITVFQNKRIGIASTDSLSAESLANCVKRALLIASHAPPAEAAPVLPRRVRIRYKEDYDPPTARANAVACVELIGKQMLRCKGAGAGLAGSLLAGSEESAVVNSEGTAAYALSSVASVKCVTQYRSLSGFASGAAPSLAGLAVDSVLERSLRQCLHRRDPVRLPLGEYAVILGPEAVAEILEWLALIAFGAKAFQERSSFLAGRMGERVMDPQISIYDDAMEPGALRTPMDWEGTPAQRVELIESGVARGIVYDTTYGARYDHPSTGHALFPGDTEGPMPHHLAIAPGEGSQEDLIRGCERGLFLPRLHYVNGLLNPREAMMTGLTREGAFLIENGKLSQPIARMRFTDSMLRAFSQIRGITAERRLIADPHTGSGCALIPSLHVAKLAFTGHSEP